MIVPHLPQNEQERLQELYSYELLDTETEQEFDELVQLAAQICGTDISCVSIIDSDRQWRKAMVGTEEAETGRDISFCGHAILSPELMMVNDALEDSRFFDNPLVLEQPFIRFYAGMPLVTPRGYNLGTLCVIDSQPKQLTEEQKFALKVLSRQAMKLIELRLRKKELEQNIKAQNKLLGIVAHDVRNPLASLKSILDLKLEGILDDEQADEMLTMSNKQLNATIEMVNNLVDWGKLQIKHRQLPKKELLLHELVNRCVETNEIGFLLKNNVFQNKVPANMKVNTDPQALQFIIRNLLSNANKFTDEGQISIEAEIQQKNTVIRVIDSGSGIPEDIIDKLLQAEKLYSQPGTRGESGSGLGLPLIREFISNINGKISFHGLPGEGTTVTVTLPF